MSKNLFFYITLCFTLLASGCASIPTPIDYRGVSKEQARIGIALSEPSKATTSYYGQIGLLDYAIIAGMNSGLDDYLASLSFEDYQSLTTDIQSIVSAQGHLPVVIEPAMSREEATKLKSHKDGVGQNDYRQYQEQHGLDYMLVLRLSSIGTTRPYYGPVPTAAPTTQAVIWGELVDLHSNRVVWFRNVDVKKSIQEPWDEPDQQYPNLTNALFQALNSALESVKLQLQNPQSANKLVSAQ